MPDFSWFRPQDYIMGGVEAGARGAGQGIAAMEQQRQRQAPSGIWESEFAPQPDPVQQEIDDAIRQYPELRQMLDDPNTPVENIASIMQALRQKKMQPGQPQAPQAPQMQMPQMQGPASQPVSGQRWDFPAPGLPGGVPWAGGQAPAPQPEPYQPAPQPQRAPFGGPDMRASAAPTGRTRILPSGDPDRQLSNEEFEKKLQMVPLIRNRDTLSQKDRYMQTKFKIAKELGDQASADKRYAVDAKAEADKGKLDAQYAAIAQRAEDSKNRLAGARARAGATLGAAKERAARKDDGDLAFKAAVALLKSQEKEASDAQDAVDKLLTARPIYNPEDRAKRQAAIEAAVAKAARAEQALEDARREVQDASVKKPAAQAAQGPQGGDKVWVRTTDGKRSQVSQKAAAALVKAGRAKVE